MQATELFILDWMQNHLRCGLLDAVLPAISWTCNHGEVWILLALLLVLRKNSRRQGWAVAAALVLDLYEKLQSHAYPDRWLEKNRTMWADLGDDFETTPYARELLMSVHRKAGHWTALLAQAAERTEDDAALRTGNS